MNELIAAAIMTMCKKEVPTPRPKEAMIKCFDKWVNKLEFDKNGNVIIKKGK